MATRLAARIVSFAAIAMALCSVAWGSSDAPSLTSVTKGMLPALPDGGPVISLAAIEGRPVAIQSTGAWLLSNDRESWTRLTTLPPGGTRGVVSDGRQAFLLTSDGVTKMELQGDTLALRALPPPPIRLPEPRGTVQGSTLYLAGIDAAGTPQLLRLATAERWTAQPPWPGGRAPTSIVAQNSAIYLTTDDRLFRWTAAAGWQDKGATPGSILAGRAIGQAHVLYVVRKADGTAGLTSFNTIPGAWATLPYDSAADIAGITPWRNGFLAAPSDGAIETVELATGQRLLRSVDWVVIVVYLAAMLGVGLYFHLRGKETAADFFVGSRSIPVWAAGISLYATNTSSISYVAIPAKAFETNWTYLANNLVTVLGLIFVGAFVVPILRRLDLVSVFNYLELRFHPAIRMIASGLCVLMQVGGRMSIVMFLPALAIATITGVSVVWSVLIMGVCTVVYTAMGGMKAVIWTDCLQVVVMFGGALFAIGFVVWSVGGGNVIETALTEDKTKLFDFSFNLTQATVWGFVVLTLLDVVLTFPKDQVLMQRVLSTKSEKSAGRSIWIFAAMTIPGGFIFYSIGTALYAYYKANPQRMDPLLPIDATFPLFIAAELPAGITGLIIAGIFAAAMSTVSSTINSVATLVTVDFYNRIGGKSTQEKSLRFAEWMSVVIGFIGIGLALVLSRYPVHSLLDTAIELAGLLGGGFAGAYTLGMFTRRANAQGVAIGIATAIVVTLVAWVLRLVHPYFYLGISILVCIVVGYIASYLFPAPTQSLAGLTLRIGKEPAAALSPTRIEQ